MKKFYLFCSALLALFGTLNANAGTRVLFVEDYEAASVYTDTKWNSPSLPGGLVITGDDYGQFLQFQLGANNSRTAQCTWGHEIFEPVADATEYNVLFDFCIDAIGNNQYDGEITVFSDAAAAATNANYRGTSANWLFDLTQMARDSEDTNTNPLYCLNGDSTNTLTLEIGSSAWYTVSLHVNKVARTVDYSISTLTSQVIASGTYEVPADVEMNAAGLFYKGPRYYSIASFDNVKVSVDVEGDYANTPSIALTGIENEKRTYNITFLEGEVLTVIGVDGAETNIDYMGADFGNYVYETSQSGTLRAYTTSGSAKSEEVSVEVDASIINVPAAQATIIAVNEGYSKTYTLTVDNSNVPLKPNIFISYVYKNDAGEVILSAEEQTTGTVVELPEKGVFEIVTTAYGYGSTTTTIANNVAYQSAAKVDFQHMSDDKLKELGFTELEVLASEATSGENNWTARKRLYFTWIKGTEVGDTVTVYPYDAEHGIHRFEIAQSKLDSATCVEKFGPVYLWCNGTEETANVKVNLGIGLINTGIKGDAQTNSIGYANAPMGVAGYDDNAFVVVTKTDNYGMTSIHPEIYNADEEAAIAEYNAMNLGTVSEVYKGTETWTLYRIDTAVTCVEVFTADPAGIFELTTDKVGDPNAPIYNLSGVRVSKNSLNKGVYIQNGKKFVVK